MKQIHLAIPLLCLAAALLIGLFGRTLGKRTSHSIAIGAVAIAFILSLVVYADVRIGNLYNTTLYTWALTGNVPLRIGFMIDSLSAMMMVVVTFVSLMVHIYTIGYMATDPGYQRFFCYIALFTFAMLMLVMANNFLQLFFGWEAVGVVSYLLIGFWYDRDSAVFANLKAFLVNRVGDFGFLLGIAAILAVFGSLDYGAVFAAAPAAEQQTLSTVFGEWRWITLICLLLFVGAMGKSAQMPLHVWLPDSMEGPTPISALIHAATMVTAGIFMVARMSPLFELSTTALSVMLVVGATTALLMGLVGLVQNDIKRVVAYSTLSQLGYMTVALGASAYHVAVFHLGTHAFFKALLFLAAGSVIMAMHHEQDMRKMGGLRTIMPITYITAAIGSLALAGIPPFAGFFSKDAIIISVGASDLFGAGFAHLALLLGVFITALYSFRLLFMTFHGASRSDDHVRQHLHESPGVVIWPLVALAVPAALAGFVFYESVADGAFFGDSIYIDAARGDKITAALTAGQSGFLVVLATLWHGLLSAPFWLAALGIFVAWRCYCKKPDLPAKIAARFAPLHRLLLRKYGFDEFYQRLFANGAMRLGQWLYARIDRAVIDRGLVDGAARLTRRIADLARLLQTGFTYHYAFAMIVGLLLLVTWFAWF